MAMIAGPCLPRMPRHPYQGFPRPRSPHSSSTPLGSRLQRPGLSLSPSFLHPCPCPWLTPCIHCLTTLGCSVERNTILRLEEDVGESRRSNTWSTVVYPRSLELSLWIHEKRQCPTRVRVRCSQGRPRDRARPDGWDHPGRRDRYRPGSSSHTLKHLVTKSAHKVSGGGNRSELSSIPNLRHSDTICGSMICTK